MCSDRNVQRRTCSTFSVWCGRRLPRIFQNLEHLGTWWPLSLWSARRRKRGWRKLWLRARRLSSTARRDFRRSLMTLLRVVCSKPTFLLVSATRRVALRRSRCGNRWVAGEADHPASMKPLLRLNPDDLADVAVDAVVGHIQRAVAPDGHSTRGSQHAWHELGPRAVGRDANQCTGPVIGIERRQ